LEYQQLSKHIQMGYGLNRNPLNNGRSGRGWLSIHLVFIECLNFLCQGGMLHF